MAKYFVEDTSLTAIADAIREKTGNTASMTLDEMPTAIGGIETGVDTSDATATSSDILSGKTAYVDGLKITGNIAFQPAKTITPTISDQIAVSAGYYTGGIVTVKGDSNLIAENIKSGVSIFGVNGTLEESSGSEGGGVVDDVSKAIINRTIASISDDEIETIGANAFASCSSLTTANFPACTSIGSSAFSSCSRLTTVSFPACASIGANAFRQCSRLTTANFPACTSIGSYAFFACSSLTTANFPACTSIGSSAFVQCSRLTTVSFPACASIGSYAFRQCSSLTTANFPACTSIGFSAFGNCSGLSTFVLAGSSVPTLVHSNAFGSTPMSTTGYFYVPSSLIAAYQAATNWTYFSSRFSAIEDANF